MTKQEAITAMKSGKKVTHRYFSSSEWITMEGGQIQTEEGYKFSPYEFWADRSYPAFESDWSLFE
jgi:hypothetical protein